MLSVPRTSGLALALALLIGASASLVAPTPTRAAEVPAIAFTTRTLANGLRVYTSLDAATPNVTVQVWYGVGSKDDPESRSGFAHLFEHLMFKATRNLPAESFDRLTEDVGGFNNASTADDYTDYLQVIPANHLERLVWAEAERMSTLVVDEARAALGIVLRSYPVPDLNRDVRCRRVQRGVDPKAVGQGACGEGDRWNFGGTGLRRCDQQRRGTDQEG